MKFNSVMTTALTIYNINNLPTMESLALPRDLYWDGKFKPTSPPSSELFSIYDELNGSWISGENFANDITIISNDNIELKHGMDLTEELLGNDEKLVAEFYDMHEENFYTPFQSLDNSLENVVGISTLVAKVQAPVNATNFSLPNSTPEVSILTQLTPPSSPPQSFASPVQHHSPASAAPVPNASAAENNLPLNFSDVFHHVSESTSPFGTEANQSEFVFSANWNNNAQSSLPAALSEDELAREMQIVDDILKSAAEELFDETESQSSVSLAPSQTDDITTDDEWLPSSGGSSPVQTSVIDSLSSSNKVNKKRTRPYGRAPEDRKIRKKEQNKNAATRYRQKKKLEMENVLVEEQDLVQRNDELNRLLTEHKREAKYLKKLIREFYKDKFSN
ncbi:bZIP transcription factor crc isoform 1-T3 [Glossina fuscipes fuscipes]